MQPTTGIPSPHVLPVEVSEECYYTLKKHYLQPSISPEDALHFYRYLFTHILIADEQFLLLIDVPIQDHTQQLEIYEVFNFGYTSQKFLSML